MAARSRWELWRASFSRGRTRRGGRAHSAALAWALLLAVTLLPLVATACASTTTGAAVPAVPSAALGPAALAEYPVPTAAASPDLIIAAPNGDLWFTEVGPRPARIGRVTSAGIITERSLDHADEVPFGLTWGPDGNLWILVSGTTAAHPDGALLRLSASGELRQYILPPIGVGRPYANALTIGPDGALWFTEGARGRIGRMTLTGAVSEYRLPSSDAAPAAITTGPDGALWFTEVQRHSIGRMTTAGFVSEFTVNDSSGQLLSVLARGPDGNLWFTDASGSTSPTGRPPDYIGRVTHDGSIHLFRLPSFDALPRGIAAGRDGNLWLTEASPTVSRVARVTPSGAITEYALPAGSAPADIAAGTNGGLWITESARNRIARLSPPTPVTAVRPAAVPGTP